MKRTAFATLLSFIVLQAHVLGFSTNDPPIIAFSKSSGGNMSLTVAGMSGYLYNVLASENLTNWTSIGTIGFNANGHIPGNLVFEDPDSTNLPVRFYHVILGSNQPPTVTLTSPTNGLYKFGVPIAMRANISDPEWDATNLTFMVDTQAVFSTKTLTYTYQWTSTNEGPHQLWAKATDQAGNVGSSLRVLITTDTNHNPEVTFIGEEGGVHSSSSGGIEFVAYATDYEGLMARVEYYVDGNYMGKAVSSSTKYTYTTTSLPLGNHTVIARAIDKYGGSAETPPYSFTIVPHTPPSIWIVSPTNGDLLLQKKLPIVVGIAASVSIKSVEYFVNEVKIGTRTAAPYNTNYWTPNTNGIFALTAKITDAFSATSISDPVYVEIDTNGVPKVELLPVESVRYGTNITLTAIASDREERISKTTIYDGATIIGYQTGKQTNTVTWSKPEPGLHVLFALVTDEQGLSGISPMQVVTVLSNQPPNIAITNLVNGQVVTNTTLIPIKVTASDADDGMDRVNYYVNNFYLGTVTSAPYTYNWKPIPALEPGEYTLQAEAVDQSGAKGWSEPVTFKVPEIPGVP